MGGAASQITACEAPNAPLCYMGFHVKSNAALDCTQLCVTHCSEWIDQFWTHLPTQFAVHLGSDARVLDVLSIYFRLLTLPSRSANEPLMQLTLIPDASGVWHVSK